MAFIIINKTTIHVNFEVQLNKEPEQYQYRISRIQVFTSMKYSNCVTYHNHLDLSHGVTKVSEHCYTVTMFYGTMTRKGSVIDHVTHFSHCRHGLFL